MFTCIKSIDGIIYCYYYLKSVDDMAYFSFVMFENFIRVCVIGSLFFSDSETRLRIDKCLCYA